MKVRQMHNNFTELVEKKTVLFITTKNIDYIRNTQEVRILKENAKHVITVFSDKKGYIGRVTEIWSRLLKYKMKDVDIVFVGFAPQLILPFFYYKMRRKTIVIDFFISVYDTLIHDRKKFKDNGPIAKFCHWIDSITLKKSNYIITDTKADAKYFIREFKSEADKFETLYLEADSSIYYPREQHKRTDLQDKFVVLYFGSVLPLQGVDIVLDAIRLLKDNSDIYFQIIGPVPGKYNRPIQENVEYINWLEQEELAKYIANADLCLAGHFNKEIDKAKRTIPGKAYIYDAMEKRMILGNTEANHEIFFENEKVIFVEIGLAKALANAICFFKLNYKE